MEVLEIWYRDSPLLFWGFIITVVGAIGGIAFGFYTIFTDPQNRYFVVTLIVGEDDFITIFHRTTSNRYVNYGILNDEVAKSGSPDDWAILNILELDEIDYQQLIGSFENKA